MAGKSAVFSLRVVADAKQASGELSKLERAVQGLESKVDKMTPAASAAGVALVGLGSYAGQAAAEAEQNWGAVDTVFKGAASTVHDFAAASAQSVGLSSSSYESLAASIGGSLQKAGYSQDELAVKTNDLISAGADLSSVFGGDAAGAAEAMGAALRGEFDSLEQYGVFMSAATVEARMAAEGTDKLTGAAFEQAKQQATVNEIMEQAGVYQGNFAREADTAAGAQQRATAEFQNAAAALGAVLLPVMTAGANALADFARWAQENQNVVQALALGVGIFAAAVFGAKGAIMTYQAATAAAKIATTVWTGAQWALNAALNANPIGLIVIAVAALVAAFIWAYENVEWFRNGVDAALAWIKDAFGNAGQWIKDTWKAATEWVKNTWDSAAEWVKNTWDSAVNWVVGKYNALVDGARTAGQWVNDTFNNAVAGVKNTWNAGVEWVISKIAAIAATGQEKAQQVKNFLGGAADFIKDKFSAFGTAVKAVFDKIGGYAQGVKDKVMGLFDGFKMPSMPDWAKKLMGGGSEAFGYELGNDGVYYAPARGMALEPPFMLTAATETLSPVTPRPSQGATQVVQKTVNVTFKMDGVFGDTRATASAIKKVMLENAILMGDG